jgi:glycosyltransferase involved in cell wall biosynthesis
MAALRILMSSERFAPIVGGLERQALLLARGLAADGHAVSVVTRRMAGLAATDTFDGIPVERLRGIHTMGPGRAGFVAGQASWGLTLARYVRARGHDFDVIHVHGLGPHGGYVARAARQHGWVSLVKIATAGVGEAGLAGRRFAPLRRRLSAGFDRYVAISGEIAAALRHDGIPASRIVRIPNAVDTQAFRPRDAAERTRARLRLAPDAGNASIVLALCRLERRKGLDTLIEAVAAMDRRDVRLVIAGDGSERGPLERLAEARGLGRRVWFVGMVDDPAAWLAVADLFALPSHVEGMPNSVLEALASGTPVVAARIPGVIDIVSDAEAWLVPPGDAGRWRAVLAEVLSDDQARAAKVAAGRARVEREFDAAAVRDAYTTLYATLIAERGAPSLRVAR